MSTSLLFKKLLIKKIISETADCKTFVLEPLEGWIPEYQAGQFLTLVFDTKRGEKRRSYSISSASNLGEPLAITVKKIDNGEFSRLLNYHAKEGEVLITSGIGGFFTLPEDLENYTQFFFIAAGSGITPCYALIKTLLGTTSKEVLLIYSNKSEADSIFSKDLKKLEEKYAKRFRVKFLFSQRSNIYESRLSNWLLPQFIDGWQHGKFDKSLFYVCGPFDYMRMVEITLLSRVPKQNIIKENFSNWPRLIIPEPPDREAHDVTINFLEKKYKIKVQYPVNILAQAKKEGMVLPYSCEAGRCGSCIASCIKGKVWMAYNEILTDNEVKEGRVLICQAYPVGGDAVIEL